MSENRWILFDFDGTLCDNFEISFQILNALADKYDFTKVNSEEIPTLRNFTAREVMTKLRIPVQKLPLILFHAKRQLRAQLPKLKAVAGIEKVLTELSLRKIKLGILTSNSQQNVQLFLAQHAFPTFQFIASRNDLFGKGRALKKLLKKMHALPEETWYVGDEARDIEAAAEAGARMAAVSWGYNSPDCLARYSPERLLHLPEELLNLSP